MPRKGQALRDNEKAVQARLEAERHCYGAVILGASTGPRRELTLKLAVWRHGTATEKAHVSDWPTLTIHFSAISNYAAVREFFGRELRESLHYLRYASEPRPRHHIIEMEFDRNEDFITIVAGNASIVGPDDGDVAR
jgi:hypothetical protein